jgi:hypothetical protein
MRAAASTPVVGAITLRRVVDAGFVIEAAG